MNSIQKQENMENILFNDNIIISYQHYHCYHL